MIFFTADTHFGHERTRVLHKRPFKTVARMDTEIIDNWNEVVSNGDTVYHLGDFGDFSRREQLNGDIILVKGNYDVNVPEDLFSEVVNCTTVLICGEPVFLNHYPSKHHTNDFNLFGHVHKLCMVKRYGLNVGMDCHDFKPVDIETVLFYKDAILNHYDNEVFE